MGNHVQVRLEALGEEKLLKIKNELLRGTSTTKVARMIQGWGDLLSMPEATLVQKMLRFRKKIAQETLGEEVNPSIKGAMSLKELVRTQETQGVKFTTLERFRNKSHTNPLEELYALAELQRYRIDKFFQYEENKGKIDGPFSYLLDDYKRLLLDIQKMRFERGLDEYHLAKVGVKAGKESITLPDGTNIQRTVMEAATLANTILSEYGVEDPRE